VVGYMPITEVVYPPTVQQPRESHSTTLQIDRQTDSDRRQNYANSRSAKNRTEATVL